MKSSHYDADEVTDEAHDIFFFVLDAAAAGQSDAGNFSYFPTAVTL